MYLLLGNSQMERNDYEGAMHSFKCARDRMRPHTSRLLLVISLVRFLTNVFTPKHITTFGRSPAGNLTDFTSLSDSVSVKPYL